MPQVLEAENRILTENARAGTLEWKLTNPATPGWPLADASKTPEIEGYASAASVNTRGLIRFFVDVREPNLNTNFALQIFRLGWYGGLGGRRMTWAGDDGPVDELVLDSVKQPIPEPNDVTGLVACQWAVSYELSVPKEWLSGIYLSKLTAFPTGKQSYILFVVREDFRSSDFLYQASVTTWQAYNPWGGRSLYNYPAPATTVSFNRPYAATSYPFSVVNPNFNRKDLADNPGTGEFFNQIGSNPGLAWEYNMVRWLEKNDFDVTYCTSIDVHEAGLNPSGKGVKAFLSVGHDEYWSEDMRVNVEDARDRGVNLGFFGANTCYWRIHFDPSLRSFYCNKSGGVPVDLWRGRVGNPEIAMIGVQYVYNSVDWNLRVPDPLPDHFAYDFTGLVAGESVPGLLGYEIDGEWDRYPAGVEASRPISNPGTVRLTASRFQSVTTTAAGTAYSSSYTADSGARVFATGSMQWNWGLDDYNYRSLRSKKSRISPKIQQLSFNILRDFVSAPAPTQPITFQGADGQVQGDWSQAYGVEGSCLFTEAPPTVSPGFPGSVFLEGATLRVFDPDSQDPRAMAVPNQDGKRVAAAATSTKSFLIHVNLQETNRQLVTLYCVDWEGRGARQRISLFDARDLTHALDVRDLTLPTNGVHLSWVVSGDCVFKVDRDEEFPGTYCEVSGVFLGGAGRAYFFGADVGGAAKGTQGDWISKTGQRAYGLDGFELMNYRSEKPDFVRIASHDHSSFAFQASASDVRALRAVDANGKPKGNRFVGGWNSIAPFSIDVALTDTSAHQFSLYFVDWDGCDGAFLPRRERVDVIDGKTEEILDTRSLPQEGNDFCQGTYLTWNIRGSVKFRVSSENADNAIVNAYFFDPEPAPILSVSLSKEALPAGVESAPILSWSAIPGRRYQIQSARVLSRTMDWEDVGDPIVTKRNTESRVQESPQSGEARLYRVLLLP